MKSIESVLKLFKVSDLNITHRDTLDLVIPEGIVSGFMRDLGGKYYIELSPTDFCDPFALFMHEFGHYIHARLDREKPEISHILYDFYLKAKSRNDSLFELLLRHSNMISSPIIRHRLSWDAESNQRLFFCPAESFLLTQ